MEHLELATLHVDNVGKNSSAAITMMDNVTFAQTNNQVTGVTTQAALRSLITVLAGMGLVVDNTSF